MHSAALLYIHSVMADLSQVCAGWATTVRRTMIGSFCSCNNHEGNSKNHLRRKREVPHCLTCCWQHSVLCCPGCFTSLYTHHIIDCTPDRVKATSCCHENNLLASPLSPQTSNETDSQKESFGPLRRVSNECVLVNTNDCLKGIWPV